MSVRVICGHCDSHRITERGQRRVEMPPLPEPVLPCMDCRWWANEGDLMSIEQARELLDPDEALKQRIKQKLENKL